MCAEPIPQTRTTRRHAIGLFLGGGVLASLASFLYPVLRFLVPPPVVDLGGDEVVAAKVGDLKPNSGEIFRFGSRPGLLILESDGTYRALSATCTHLGCTVQYRADLRADLVPVPQRNLRSQWPQCFRSSAETAGCLRRSPARRRDCRQPEAGGVAMFAALYRWLDERLASGRAHRAVQPQDRSHASTVLLVLFRRHHAVSLHRPGAHRDPAAPVLPPRRQRGLRKRAVHHDAGAVWLADSFHPLLVGQPDDLHGLRAHVQRAVSQGLPQAQRADVGQRHAAALSGHGIRLQRLPAALEQAGLLRHQGWHADGRTGSHHRPAHDDLSSRRPAGDRSHADPILWIPCCRSARVGHRADRDPPVSGAAPGHERPAQG